MSSIIVTAAHLEVQIMEQQIPYWSVIPFVLILLSIAFFPLKFPHWWEKNSNKGIIATVLSVPVAIYFMFIDYHQLIHAGIEYFSFIVLLGSLFVISGGVLVKGDLEASPKVNTIFLAIGAVLANLIGTTGASMVLIRPLLSTNKERKHISHIPIFFIFIVSNIGGLLTPLADPPLFLGFLRGVHFTWTLKLFPFWLVAVSILLMIFYVFDHIAYKKEKKRTIDFDKTHITPLRIEGKINIIFLLGVVISILGSGYLEQHKISPTPWREIVMILLAVLSYKVTPKKLHEENSFSFTAINEVAVLFAGIFVTMIPALLLLRTHGSALGITHYWQYFWLTGGLSSFLDNAPTYLTFLSLAQGATETMVSQGADLSLLHISGGAIYEGFLEAISVGAVFMGANTYIGNGPNFMVKSIAEHAGVKMPSFFGFMKYSILILIPIFLVLTFIFFV